MVFSIITFLFSLGMFYISYSSFKEKGFLFNNTYIYSSKKERENMNKKPYYKQSAIIFLLLGIGFLLITLNIFISHGLLTISIFIVLLLAIIYAIVSSINIFYNKN